MNDTENKLVEAENEETKKSGSFSGLFHKVTDFGKKSVEKVQKSAKAMSDKSKEDAYQKRLEKYNPISAEDYASDSFSMPNMIVIADNVKRKEIDVLENAVGWQTIEKDVHILHLFEDSVKIKKITFFPNCQCDAFYYVDNDSSMSYTRVDCIFSKAHDEKMAELKHIAHSLGAKSCTIEITEKRFNSEEKSNGYSAKLKIAKGANIGGGMQRDESSASGESRSGKITAVFEGSDKPRKPKLKWFAQDQSIKRLIETRCTETNTVKSETLELRGSNSSVMSQKTACSIDIAMCKIGGKMCMESQAVTENDSTLIFSVEF